MTDNKLFSITEESEDYLDVLPDTIKIIVINEPGVFDSYIKKVLDKMDQMTNKLSVEYIDPDLHPDDIKKYEVDSVLEKNTIIVANNIRFESFKSMDCYALDENDNVIGFNAEGKIISTIIKVIDNKQKVIKYTTGHDEGGYTEMSKLFIGNNMTVAKINLNSEKLDSSTDILIVSNPQRDFDPIEINEIDNYTKSGGKIMIFKDPRVIATPRIDQFLAIWGLRNENNIIVDQTYYYLNNPLYLIAQITNSDEYRKIASMDKIIITPFSQSIEMLFKNGENGAYSTKTLLSTSARSYAKTKIINSSFTFSSGDVNGPFPIALLTSNSSFLDSKSIEASVFLCGSGLFADDTLMTVQNFANSDFILAVAFNMMGSRENFSVAVKYFDSGYLNISSKTAKILGNTFTLVIPIGIFLYGLYVWIKRRNK